MAKKHNQKRHNHNQSHKKKPVGGDQKRYEGDMFLTASGTGFASVEGFEEDILIHQEDLGTALHGDRVELIILPEVKGRRREGKVMKVLETSKRTFTGVMKLVDGTYVVETDNRRMYTDIEIPGNKLGDATEGMKVLARITRWTDSTRRPLGEVLDVVGSPGEHETEMRAIVLDRGIDYDFPPHVEKEAQDIHERYKGEAPEEILEKEPTRRDLRTIPTFTIDPVDAKDFDDAISFQKNEDGTYEVGVHIADVAFYVEPKTAIDKEARERSFSVYLVDRTIPMLPEVLSNDLCSLNPQEPKRAFSGIFTLTPEGEVKDHWFGRSLIVSDRRFTYEDAQQVIDTKEGDYTEELQILNTLAKKMREDRLKAGSIAFEDDEVKFEIGKDGAILGIHKKERLDTHKLVEEMMLLCNREVAKFIDIKSKKEGRDHIFLYRTHDKPNREKLESLANFLRSLGIDVKFTSGEEITGEDINAVLEHVHGHAVEGLVNASMIRSMSKAEYETNRKGHFGLAFSHYSHFTSPIRRYPDLLIHRLLDIYLKGGQVSKKEAEFYTRAAQHASQREIEVLDAERESIKYKQVEYMIPHVGETFEGVITGVIEHGFFVEENESRAEGLVPVSTLGNDYYEYNEKQYALVGKNTGKKFQLGDEVKVELVAADLEARQITWKLVEKIEKKS